MTFFRIVCDLIEEKRPPGIFAALNDACATAHADSSAADNSFTQRLSACSSNPHFNLRGHAFLVKHYAGDVLYEIPGMTDKNKDQLNRDLLDLLEGSGNQFVGMIFPEKVDRDSKKRPPTASDRIKVRRLIVFLTSVDLCRRIGEKINASTAFVYSLHQTK